MEFSDTFIFTKFASENDGHFFYDLIIQTRHLIRSYDWGRDGCLYTSQLISLSHITRELRSLKLHPSSCSPVMTRTMSMGIMVRLSSK